MGGKPDVGASSGLVVPETAAGSGITGIVGHPVGHSLSPVMHNAAFAALGMRWVYVAFDITAQKLGEALGSARARGFRGLNVTAPHKAAAAALVDRLAGAAAEIGAVNTIVFAEDEAVGYSTDGEGFLAACEDQGWVAGPELRAVVIGAGGAGVSVAHALLGRGVGVALANRDPGRLAGAESRLAAAAAGGRAPLSLFELADPRLGQELASADLLVSSLPPSSGLAGGLDLTSLPPAARVCELAYHPPESPLVAAAQARGHRAWNGLGMLVHQGAASFTLWSGREAPLAIMAGTVGYSGLSGEDD